jgi:hypothetical protein
MQRHILVSIKYQYGHSHYGFAKPSGMEEFIVG